MECIVIGGGITGRFTAYYLLKAGHGVTVIDGGIGNIRTSRYNAGFLVKSFSSSPIGISRIASAYFTRKGPVYISLRQMLKNPAWFRIASRKGLSGFEKAMSELGSKSLLLHMQFLSDEKVEVDAHAQVVGLYNNEEDARAMSKMAGGRFMNSRETETMGYSGFGGGALFEEMTVHPGKLMDALQELLQTMGAKLLDGKAAMLKTQGNRVASVFADGQEFIGDAYVVAGGAWSSNICKPLKYNPQILPARGLALIYDTSEEQVVDHAALLEDEGITLSQHDKNTLRMTSYFEMTGFKDSFDQSRKDWLFNSARRHLNRDPKLKLVETGVGYRPVTPDQIPVIGKIPGFQNAYIASGSGRQGVTLAPIAGMYIANMVSDREVGPEAAHADPGRFA